MTSSILIGAGLLAVGLALHAIGAGLYWLLDNDPELQPPPVVLGLVAVICLVSTATAVFFIGIGGIRIFHYFLGGQS